MDLRDATPTERGQVLALLERAQLPTADLASSAVEFIVAVEDGAVVGTIGLEAHGTAGLLRSLCVDAGRRGSGVGDALVAAIEARASARRIDELVLLTTTAREYFARRGYAAIARDAAPASVQRSAEFRSLCPASSTCMLKRIGAT